ncbi:Etp1 protein [Maudiozyma humilis]|uniref:Etp1 protein n=1 Tax=Maudiozyma humilis TaxID=51915 RepID=A0AAV5S4G3_MAUHU|nr:Etp1 protein [Kazachstania humilis]
MQQWEQTGESVDGEAVVSRYLGHGIVRLFRLRDGNVEHAAEGEGDRIAAEGVRINNTEGSVSSPDLSQCKEKGQRGTSSTSLQGNKKEKNPTSLDSPQDNKKGKASISPESLQGSEKMEMRSPDDATPRDSDTTPDSSQHNDKMEIHSPDGPPDMIIPGDDTMMCILAVPTYFTVHDLLHFYIGDDICNSQVAYFRILKSVDGASALGFMVLLKFRDATNARSFHDSFNGRAFNKVDPEKCHVVPIKEVVFRRGALDHSLPPQKDASTLPYLLSDPFTSTTSDDTPQIELPTCPVCLERMDAQTTGLITIPCQHTFHCRCLDKWKNSRCPVCRFSSFRLSRDSLLKQMGNRPKCSTCAAPDNLWVCLVCGNVGCGRYNSKHAIQHFEDSSHCFAMDIKTQRVWDYAGDNYVHRLVQNEIDGKLVEVGLSVEQARTQPQQGQAAAAPGSSNGKHSTAAAAAITEFTRNKEYHLEYVQVLVSQLESQREYYEAKLHESAQKQQTSTEDAKLISDLRQRVADLQLQAQKNDKEAQEAAHKAAESKLIIRGLQDNIQHSAKESAMCFLELQRLQDERQELQAQITDLSFHLDNQMKFKDASGDVRNGTIVVSTPESESPVCTFRKNKKKNKNRNRNRKPNGKTPTLEEVRQRFRQQALDAPPIGDEQMREDIEREAQQRILQQSELKAQLKSEKSQSETQGEVQGDVQGEC